MDQPAMPEILLRRIWQGLLFTTDHLKTADGKAVTILSPGTPNDDAGPDFLNAKISIGGVQFAGDVELHINAAQWRQHRHDTDPHYNTVILHVVLAEDPLAPPARTKSMRRIPLLVLHPYLDEKTFQAWTSPANDDGRPAPPYCRDMNEHVPSEVIQQWIERLGLQRVELKVRRFEERLKQLIDESRQKVSEPFPRYYGDPAEIPHPARDYTRKDFSREELWEQLLYEGILEALGYTKNTRPFAMLSRSVRVSALKQMDAIDDHPTAAAVLFGVAGLLPGRALSNAYDDEEYINTLINIWNRIQPEFTGQYMNEGDWLFFRLRPNNFPTARLAAFVHLLPQLFGGEALHRFTALFKDGNISTSERLKLLRGMFHFTPNGFWKRHYHFKSAARIGSSRSNPIALGLERINDIITNVVIPIMLLYARIFRQRAIGRNVRDLLAILPAAQKNSVISTVTRHITKDKVKLSSAVRYQGALQMYKLYCSPFRCPECAIGHRAKVPPPPQNA